MLRAEDAGRLMCLKVTVRVPAAERTQLEAAARNASKGNLSVEVAHAPRWPWARGHDAEAVVSERGGCACSLLTEEADWGAESWAMRPEVLEPLARTLLALAERGPDGMTVEALWVGEKPDREQAVTAHELAALARASRLGTRTRYVLSRDTV